MKLSSSLAKLPFASMFAALVLLLAAGCAHHRDVRASADGVHWVELKAETEEEGMREALSQANHFCEERKMAAAIVSEDKKYKGDMDESDYKALKKAGKVAQTAGGAVYVLGAPRESNIGGLVGLGGTVANQVAGEGYAVKLKFKCI